MILLGTTGKAVVLVAGFNVSTIAMARITRVSSTIASVFTGNFAIKFTVSQV